MCLLRALSGGQVPRELEKHPALPRHQLPHAAAAQPAARQQQHRVHPRAHARAPHRLRACRGAPADGPPTQHDPAVRVSSLLLTCAVGQVLRPSERVCKPQTHGPELRTSHNAGGCQKSPEQVQRPLWRCGAAIACVRGCSPQPSSTHYPDTRQQSISRRRRVHMDAWTICDSASAWRAGGPQTRRRGPSRRCRP